MKIAFLIYEGFTALDVIGPYEVYEDELLGVKAAYEAMITLRFYFSSLQK